VERKNSIITGSTLLSLPNGKRGKPWLRVIMVMRQKKRTVELDGTRGGATNCIMATAQMSLMFYQNGEEEKVGINTAALVSFHQVHDGK